MKVARGVALSLAALFCAIFLVALCNVKGDAFTSLLQDTSFIRAVLFSVQTSLVATLLAGLAAIPIGLYLARTEGAAVRVVDALFDLPLVIPPLIVGVLLLSFFNTPLVKSVYDCIFTMPGAIAAQFFVAVPLSVRAVRNAFGLVPEHYEQIAMTLGAHPAKAFYDTTFTIALPAIRSGLVLAWLRCLGEFGATLMVGGGIPGRTENIPIYIYLNMSSGEFDKGMAAAIVATFAAFCCIALIRLLGSTGNKRL